MSSDKLCLKALSIAIIGALVILSLIVLRNTNIAKSPGEDQSISARFAMPIGSQDSRKHARSPEKSASNTQQSPQNTQAGTKALTATQKEVIDQAITKIDAEFIKAEKENAVTVFDKDYGGGAERIAIRINPPGKATLSTVYGDFSETWNALSGSDEAQKAFKKAFLEFGLKRGGGKESRRGLLGVFLASD